MKKLLMISCLVLMFAGAGQALAQVDNYLGLSFDSEFYNYQLHNQPPNTPFYAYVVLLNPTGPEIHGLEFGYDIVVQSGSEGLYFRLGNSLPPGAIDLGNNTGTLEGDYVVGLASPLPAASTVVFVTWQFMILGNGLPMDFFFGPSDIQSIPDGLPAYEIGGTIVPLELAPLYNSNWVGCVNNCGVATEETSFGSVKSLYR